MKQIAKLLGIIALAVAATACDGEVTADLYVRDVLDLAEGGVSDLLTTATVAVQASGGAEETRTYIENNFRDAGNFRQQNRNFTNFILADIKIPIANAEAERDYLNDQDLVAVVVRSAEDGGAEFGIVLNREKYRQISQHVEDEYYQSISPQDMTIQLRLSNDSRRDVTVQLSDVYANQEPLPFERSYELSSRDAVELRFSNVLRDYLFEEGSVYIGRLGRGE